MAELREIGPEQLKEILEEHRMWVESDGKEGERADPSFANLKGADLSWTNHGGHPLAGSCPEATPIP